MMPRTKGIARVNIPRGGGSHKMDVAPRVAARRSAQHGPCGTENAPWREPAHPGRGTRADAMPTEERMADVNTRGTGRGTSGSTMMLGLLLLVVLVLVVWLVMRGGGEDANVEVNVPQVETPNVEVKSSGG